MIQIVEIVLRQGLVHPITCVPYLIALETDPQEANSKLAHHLLMNMNEKYYFTFLLNLLLLHEACVEVAISIHLWVIMLIWVIVYL